MNESVFNSILDVKIAMMEKDSQHLATIRNEMSTALALKASLRGASHAKAEDVETGAALHVAIRYEAAQSARLVRLDSAINEIGQRLSVAEARLRNSLGEKRAIERLISELNWS